MVERLKDDADRKLESLFAAAALDDDGFSKRVMARVRRQIWVRRLSMPIAIVLGMAVAAKPITELINVIPSLVSVVPSNVARSIGIDNVAASLLPQLSTVFLGGMLLFAIMMISRMLED